MGLRIDCVFLLYFFPITLSKNVVLFIADDGGFESWIYNNSQCSMSNLENIAIKGSVFLNAYTSVSSCSPSRASILSGQPQHQNGMYGLENSFNHFSSFANIKSLPNILNENGIYTGLIGKKHVAPKETYKFMYEKTENDYSIEQIGRNITFMKEKVQDFFVQFAKHQKNNPATSRFFLMIAFHDPHRCSKHMELGAFCDKFGDGTPLSKEVLEDIEIFNFTRNKSNIIPDWFPIEYDPNDISVPYFIPDTIINRQELAAQYKTISRLDQGIGLVMKELENFCLQNSLTNNHSQTTLIIYTSDNGVPFPFGRTNMYQPGIKVPLVAAIYEPNPSNLNYQDIKLKHDSILDNNIEKQYYEYGFGLNFAHEKPQKYHLVEDYIVISYDIKPTILDWFGLTDVSSNAGDGHSFLNLIHNANRENTYKDDTLPKRRYAFFSQSLHEITMYYPMRGIIDAQSHYKLIHNLNHESLFRIDTDFYASRCFQEILNNSHNASFDMNRKSLAEYYYRPRWELYYLATDNHENINLHTQHIIEEKNLNAIFNQLKTNLFSWQNLTLDPWLCAPDGVLIETSKNKIKKCCPLNL